VARGHSGSTLLTSLLARHPQAMAVGEMANLGLQLYRKTGARWVGLCSCGERPHDCPVWGPALAEVERRHSVDLDEKPFSWRMSDIGLEEEYRQSSIYRAPLVWIRNRYWRLFRYLQYGPFPFLGRISPQREWVRNRVELMKLVAESANARIVVDASKDPLDMRDLLEYADLPMKVVFLTRDARGNVWSEVKNSKQEAARKSGGIAAAENWVRVNGRILKLLEGYPGSDWTQLRYEDMCAEPKQTFEKLFDFLGLERADVTLPTLDPNANYKPEHTVGGNKIRFTSAGINIRPDTGWTKGLTDAECRRIADIVSPLDEKLGYRESV